MHRILLSLALGLATVGCATQAQSPVTSPPAPLVEQAKAPIVAADLIELEATAANRFVEAGRATEAIVRLQIRAGIPEATSRPQANIAIVVDTSASMEGDAIEQARAAALAMLEGLTDGDRLSVVAFHSRADVLVASSEITADSRPAIRDAINSMRATGTTALADGLAAGAAQLEPHASVDTVSRMVLLSDGIPNDAAQIPSLAQRLQSRSIPVTALGLGVEYHEGLLATLASTTGGRFQFVEGTDQVAKLFREEVLHIDRLVAQGSSLSLSCGPGVTIAEVVGRPEVPAGQSIAQVNIGDLAQSEHKDVVVRLAIEPRADTATVELLDARLQYGDAVTNAGVLSRDAFLAVRATGDAATRASGADVPTELVAAKAIAASQMLSVVTQTRSGDLAGALNVLRAGERRARKLAKRFEDDELLALANGMAELRRGLPALAPREPKGAGKNKENGRPPGAGTMEPAPSVALGTGGLGGTGAGVAESVKRNHSRAYNALH